MALFGRNKRSRIGRWEQRVISADLEAARCDSKQHFTKDHPRAKWGVSEGFSLFRARMRSQKRCGLVRFCPSVWVLRVRFVPVELGVCPFLAEIEKRAWLPSNTLFNPLAKDYGKRISPVSCAAFSFCKSARPVKSQWAILRQPLMELSDLFLKELDAFDPHARQGMRRHFCCFVQAR